MHAIKLLASWNGFPAGHLRVASSQAAAERAFADHPAGEAELVELAEVPASRAFRDCWRAEASKAAVDMPLARTARLDQVRRVRDKELARLDVEQLRGRDVDATKQALRDLPATVLARDDMGALTADELADWLPDELRDV